MTERGWIGGGTAQNGTYEADDDRRFRQRSSVLPAPVVASRPVMYSGTVTDAGRCCRLQHTMVQDANDLRLVYMNTYGSGGGVGDDTDANIVPIKVRASIEYTSGRFYPVHFPGEDSNRDVTIQPGGRVISDPLPVPVEAGTVFWTNTLVVPTSAGAYPAGAVTIRPGGPEACNPASTTDYTMSANPGTAVGQFAYGPMMVLGTPAGETARRSSRTVAVLSDSYVNPGTGDSFINNIDEKGWAARAYSGRIGWFSVSLGGDQLRSSWLLTGNTPKYHRYRMILAAGADWVVDGLGTNDFYTAIISLADFYAGKLALWTALSERGVKVRSHTIAPRTSSTDSWATSANQTAYNAYFGPEGVGGSIRQQYNAWLRAGAPTVNGVAVAVGTAGALKAGDEGHPLSSVFDLAAPIETYQASIDTWVWKANYTTDGIHPDATAAAAIAAAEDVSVFT